MFLSMVKVVLSFRSAMHVTEMMYQRAFSSAECHFNEEICSEQSVCQYRMRVMRG